jgi:hypothetical protein
LYLTESVMQFTNRQIADLHQSSISLLNVRPLAHRLTARKQNKRKRQLAKSVCGSCGTKLLFRTMSRQNGPCKWVMWASRAHSPNLASLLYSLCRTHTAKSAWLVFGTCSVNNGYGNAISTAVNLLNLVLFVMFFG